MKDTLTEKSRAAPITIGTLGLQGRNEPSCWLFERRGITPRACHSVLCTRGTEVRRAAPPSQTWAERVCCRSEMVQAGARGAARSGSQLSLFFWIRGEVGREVVALAA